MRVDLRSLASRIAIVGIAVASGAVHAAEVEPAPDREACAEHDPLRRPFFGDLHVHSAWSLDAATQGTRNGPAAAYRFAKGERMGIQPYDEDGNPLRSVQLAQPLDFAAVTDHAELLGEVEICTNPALEGHDSWPCFLYRYSPRLAFFVINYQANRAERFEFCGENGEACLAASRTPWRDIQEAAEAAYDRSAACTFTSFVGYEWTGADGTGVNTHRNVIFRNARVPDLPASFVDAPTPPELWQSLRRNCTGAGEGCHAIVIPHNSNLGMGKMFRVELPDGSPIGREEVEGRREFEKLVEIMQHKGDSECYPGLGNTDEQCGFEKIPYGSFMGRYVTFLGEPAPARSYVRNILKDGLRVEERLGTNPFQLGFIASTDTHLSAPGLTDETSSYPGHGGAGRPARAGDPLAVFPDSVEFNPGGLAVVWAEENSRDALFDAMERREVYGTSGPRLIVRMFAGWDYRPDLCAAKDFAKRGYAGGVPMGGELGAPPVGTDDPAPVIAVSALRAPGTPDRPGALLQTVQIVKGWVKDGTARERVYDVAGNRGNGATVDLNTCEAEGAGDDALCSVWRDPDFDPAERAFYYARVLQNPTCRWSTRFCNAARVDCSDPPDALAECCDATWPRTVQERAWTSPIWYVPAASVAAR